jgi:DNA-binding IscR family transcriptional regulator
MRVRQAYGPITGNPLQSGETAMTEDFILGDSALHQRLCAITEILGKFVASAPRPLSVRQLAEDTGRAEADLDVLCVSLDRAHLLRPNAQSPGCRELACAPDQVTLEDVFRCVMAEQPARVKPSEPANTVARRPQRTHRDADLLVMQAAMAINQSMFQHLRQFSLDRLKVGTAASFPQHFGSGRYARAS